LLCASHFIYISLARGGCSGRRRARTDLVHLLNFETRSASPVGPYYSTGFKPVKLYATTKDVRAWPGGTGGFKLGSNYAAGVVPQQQAAALGYQQILWLFGPEHRLTEVGTMNLFVAIKKDDGGAFFHLLRAFRACPPFPLTPRPPSQASSSSRLLSRT